MYSNELYHHGIKGQRWGVRRFQNKNGSLTPAGKERYSVKGDDRNQSSKSSKNAHDFINSKSGTPVSNLAGGDAELLAIQATAYIAMVATAVITNKVVEKQQRKNKAKELEELNENKDIKSFKDAPKLKTKMSPADSAKVTNPDYPDSGTTMNCTFCTTAMALREKGYDVKAAKLSDGWYSDDLFSSTFNSPSVKTTRARTTSDVLNELSSQGDGAYGNLTVQWFLGGRHSIFWKNENGTTNFYDGQSGKKYTSYADKNSLLSSTNIRQTEYNRLDNCEPTDYALAVVERNDK